MKTIGILLLFVVVTGGFAAWFVMKDAQRQAREDFFSTEKIYDTTGGQEMRPRW